MPAVDRFVGGVTRTHFRGSGAVRGDAGFAPEYRDDHLYADLWGYETPYSRQTGHFLTAVDMGAGDGPLWMLLAVGHEQAPDPRLGEQIGGASLGDLVSFSRAVRADEPGQVLAREAYLSSILDESKHGELIGRRGNSMADLRLTVRGWRLGSMIAQGRLGTNKDLATWMALNVAGN
jgi:hypothetical protein